MAPNRPFANYPGAKAVKLSATPADAAEEDKNPILHGLALVAAASLVNNVPTLQRFFWNNAKFGVTRDMPELAGYDYRLHPDVVPLPIRGEENTELDLDFGLDLKTPAPEAKGRYLSSVDYQTLYRDGTLTPLDVVSALLPLTRRNQTPENKYQNAWVDSYDNEWRAREAAEASTKRWAEGKPLGPLDGVPVSVKDDIDVEGYVSHMGLRYYPKLPFFAAAKETAGPIRALEAAGAIVVAKNAMHELGSDTSGCNPTWGTPTNFHNPAYYPGGSSSGGGSALGAGLVPIAIGTDAGGSIRVPASANGVYGLKPTHHRTTTMRHSCCVTGPLAATVTDLTLAYRLAPSLPPPSATHQKVIAIDKAWWARADPAGYAVLDTALPHLRAAQLVHSLLCIAEMHADISARLPEYRSTPAADYLGAGRLRQLIMQHLASLFEAHPGLLLVTPTDANKTIAAMSEGEGGRLPVGLMALGEWGAEEQLLAWAGEGERYLSDKVEGGREAKAKGKQSV
ncbi:Fatty acid amide hydrolase like protein [Verticillium longisporum]|uniref:Fatty acid amide hydrolase like protein n=1 Tax=Verticillium longisporum TaxID=100787 RepID=A0A8I3AN22_VERLO|nr:Fatty acid amide hydrolase like protein [Verticillium longisporum]